MLVASTLSQGLIQLKKKCRCRAKPGRNQNLDCEQSGLVGGVSRALFSYRQHPPYRRPPNPQLLGNRCLTQSLCGERPNLLCIVRFSTRTAMRLPALAGIVNTSLAQFIAVCSAYILAETLCYTASLASQFRAKSS